MSFRALLSHTCDLYDLRSSDDDGSPIVSYQKINDKPIPCRLDPMLVRAGKDQTWLASVARVEDRTGVMFFLPNAPLKSGLRISMVKGPPGAFEIKGALDEIWDFDSLHHYEVGVTEVSTLQWRAPKNQTPGAD